MGVRYQGGRSAVIMASASAALQQMLRDAGGTTIPYCSSRETGDPFRHSAAQRSAAVSIGTNAAAGSIATAVDPLCHSSDVIAAFNCSSRESRVTSH